jgi:hypothetical protein
MSLVANIGSLVRVYRILDPMNYKGLKPEKYAFFHRAPAYKFLKFSKNPYKIFSPYDLLD